MDTEDNNSKAARSAASRQYQPYLDAEWGFKNAWYPALFSHELKEGEVKGVTIAGHEIALRRARGLCTRFATAVSIAGCGCRFAPAA